MESIGQQVHFHEIVEDNKFACYDAHVELMIVDIRCVHQLLLYPKIEPIMKLATEIGKQSVNDQQ